MVVEIGEPRHTLELERLPETNDELWWLVRYLWGIEIPRVAVCQGHSAPFDVFADAYFARYPVIVAKASRGLAGKTFMFSYLALTEAVLLGAGVSLLGGSLEQSNLAHEYAQAGWESDGAPVALLKNDPTARETELHNGGRLRVLAASTKSVRGKHEPRLRLDEADEMKRFVFESALGQPMPQPGAGGVLVSPQTTISSTHHYPDKTFSYILEDLAPEMGWPVHEWCYREARVDNEGGWLHPTTIETTKGTVPRSMWIVEYELQEPNVEGRAVDADKVGLVFDPDLGEYEGAEGEYLEIEPPAPGAEYAHGADWARKADYTVIATYRTDVTPWRLVAWERLGRRAWPEMVRRFEERLRRYPPAIDDNENITAAHDGTGLGDVVDGFLDYEPKPDSVILVGQRRANILAEYVSALEDEAIVSPRIKWAYDEHRYATSDDLYGRGHLPDSMAAGALAWSTRDTRPIGLAAGPAGVAKPR